MAITDKEFGRTGAKRYGGIFYEEFLPELRGTKGVRTYSEMAIVCDKNADSSGVVECATGGT